MHAVQVQTPAFFFERAIDQLAARFPADAMERLRANLKAFRAWVAEPAFRAPGADAAVTHVLEAVGPAVQFKAEFLAVLASVPQGVELFIEAVTEDLVDMVPDKGPQGLAEAADLLQRAQRTWLRFAVFHPDLAGVEAAVGGERLGEVLTLGFHADNLLTVCLMAGDGDSAPPKKSVQKALCGAARDYAQRYHQAVRGLVEAAAPPFDEADPFKPTTLADLLALPPYDGPAATPDEMDDAIGALFESP